MISTVRLLLALPVLVLAGCGSFLEDPGAETSQERTISGITAVELNTSGTLTMTQGPSEQLTITAGENVMDRLTSDVNGGTLVLDTKGSVGNLGTVRYELVLPTLEQLELNGSGDATLDGVPGDSLGIRSDGSGTVTGTGLDAHDLTVELSGSGDVVVSGTAEAQELTLDGSGSYRAEQLESRTARVEVDGSGDADVQVSDALDATVSGSGHVTYSGDPDVQSHIDGSGDVSAR